MLPPLAPAAAPDHAARSATHLFGTVLVANRGEIACRVIRTLKRLGIRSVAVYSDADLGARHVREADVAVRIGPPPAGSSYLDILAVIAAAVDTGADAIHPGYGFLSENADFARACGEVGIVFVGPGVEALEIMGDKIRSREQVTAFGVPVVPGAAVGHIDESHIDGSQPGGSRIDELAARIGFPLIVKPSAGGGGKGMQVVTASGELHAALASARRTALSAFGDDALLLERLIETPRHIEVQVLADAYGAVIHLGERECSLQRRHQKVIEEAPSPTIDETTRARIGEAACDVARSVDYRGAGTVEFLIAADRPDEFFFIEMNARLQVEHPVTEFVTGIDLVEQQLRIAAGNRLGIAQDDVVISGHAIEARVYAEDAKHGFLPGAGTVLALTEPDGAGIRVDSSLIRGLVVGSDYDPMLAKIIAHGTDRREALTRLDAALEHTVILGVTTNLEYLRLLLAEPEVVAGALDTSLIERRLIHLEFRSSDAAALVAAMVLHAERVAAAVSVWHRPSGWRLGNHRPTRYRLGVPSADGNELHVIVTVDGTPDAAKLEFHGETHLARLGAVADASGRRIVELDGSSESWWAVREGDDIWLANAGATWKISVRSRSDELADLLAARDHATSPSDPELRSPMPGTVVAIGASTGDSVSPGHPLVTVEAMKMEHTLVAPTHGTATIGVVVGDAVKSGQLVASVTPHSDLSSTTQPPMEHGPQDQVPEQEESPSS